MATAGMRLLHAEQQKSLLRAMCSYLRDHTFFLLPDCSTNVQVISGETEGLYGWLAANYLLGGLCVPDDSEHGTTRHTFGFLDMGGASAQIAFVPTSTESEKHAEDLKVVRLRQMDGTISEYKVFTASWLGYGANQARERYIGKLLDAQGRLEDSEIPDPCMPKGLRTTFNEGPLSSPRAHSQLALVGTGDFSSCLSKTESLLGKDEPCLNEPCLLNGQHVPLIDFSVIQFVGVSEYWRTTHGVFGGKNDDYNLVTYQQTVLDLCSRDWNDIVADLIDRGMQHSVKDAQEACFKASWLINVLHEGIGFPKLSVENEPSPGSNMSEINIQTAEGTGFRAPFQPVNRIDGVELSWTLGKIVLYASGQIPPQRHSMSYPVGFGSNIPGAADFEPAGSRYETTRSISGDDRAVVNIADKVRTKVPSTIIVLILLTLALVLFHKWARRVRWRGWLSPIIGVNQLTTSPPKFRQGYSLSNRLSSRGQPVRTWEPRLEPV